MLLIPDPATAFIDPFYETKTLVMICDVIDPITRQHYDRDPRWIARKAEMYLKNSGIADTAYFGAEAEFFIFDNVRFDQNAHSGFYFIDAEEGRWNSGRGDNNLGYRPRYKEGYFPVPPTDHYQDLRAEMVETMIEVGLDIECHHHEVATGGQCEIDQRFDTLVKSADNMMLYKYVIRNAAYQYGKTRHLHAQAAVRRQRQRHAHAPEPVEGRQAAVRGRYVRGLEPDGAVVHRRTAEARARAFGDHRADHQQLQAPGSGLRSAGESGVFAPQSLGRGAHSDVLGQPQGQARRVPSAGSVVESVPGVRGDDDGRSRRRAEQDRSGRAAGQGHLRSVAGGNEERCRPCRRRSKKR